MKLKEIRLSKGFSQSKLSKASGINLRTLQQYEQGNRNIDCANINSLIDLCLALDCKLTDILEDQTLIDKFNSVK